MMDKKAVIVVVLILGGSIFSGTLCFLADSSTQQFHDAFCTGSFHSCVYIGGTLVFLFILLLANTFLLVNPVFTPQQFASSLFKPPQHFSSCRSNFTF